MTRTELDVWCCVTPIFLLRGGISLDVPPAVRQLTQ